MTRYTYATTISFGDSDGPEFSEFDVEVSYRVVWGAPEQGPTYACGGTPADPDEVDDIRIEKIDGNPPPWAIDGDHAAMIEARFDDMWSELIAEAAAAADDREWSRDQ